jgi:hypothetical protein
MHVRQFLFELGPPVDFKRVIHRLPEPATPILVGVGRCRVAIPLLNGETCFSRPSLHELALLPHIGQPDYGMQVVWQDDITDASRCEHAMPHSSRLVN